jgi:hypothetical protein
LYDLPTKINTFFDSKKLFDINAGSALRYFYMLSYTHEKLRKNQGLGRVVGLISKGDG